MTKSQPFLADMTALRRAARADVERGAVTEAYGGNSEHVVVMLNAALATELVCMLRYRRHHAMARGLAASAVAAEFLAHANEELAHADQLAARIVELNGEPNFDPDTLTGRSHAEYVEGGTVLEMVRENLVAERIGIAAYLGMITWLGDADPTTRRVLETILAAEETQASEMADLLYVCAPPRPIVTAAAVLDVADPAPTDNGFQASEVPMPGGRMH